MPFPSASGIARRMGVQPRTVQRAIQKLVAKRLIKKLPIDGQKGRRNKYDLSPLVQVLSNLGKKDPYYLARQKKDV